jgi:hypothetical protein
MAITNANPTTDPAVPGATGKYPAPKHVAIQTAAFGALSVTFSLGPFVCEARFLSFVQTVGFHGR